MFTHLYPLVFSFVALLLATCALFFWWLSTRYRSRLAPALTRLEENPVLEPIASHWWESEAVFNPAAVVEGGRVHLFYRALGSDGVSRIGYASSADGVRFDERLSYPVFDKTPDFNPPPAVSYKTLSYNTDAYASGGGWGGVEDPRAVSIEGHIYMTFGVFESWQSLRLGVTSLTHANLALRNWAWAPYIPMSPQGQTNKNWVLFPEKINGTFAILHAMTPALLIEYVDTLQDLHENPIQSNNQRSGRKGHWDALIRGAGAPPIKTSQGWLLLYHGMDPDKNTGYQVGAMLLDLHNPSTILYQTSSPILSAEQWYEHDWKPGVVYASGAVVLGPDLLVYYGGGDKRIAAAKINLDEFLHKLMTPENKV